jgi:hypothetical protein
MLIQRWRLRVRIPFSNAHLRCLHDLHTLCPVFELQYMPLALVVILIIQLSAPSGTEMRRVWVKLAILFSRIASTGCVASRQNSGEKAQDVLS